MTMWDPFEEIGKMHKEMEKLFTDFYGRSASMLPAKSGEHKDLARMPVTGLRETDKDVIATFEVPGANKEDIELNVTENSVEVKAEKRHEKEEKSKDFYGFTSVSKSFYRKLPLPCEVAADQSTAEYKDGILKVTMPKANSEEKNKKIEIK